MGVELHITRAHEWLDNQDQQIGADEWLAFIAADPELQLCPEHGPLFVRWLGKSALEDPWLDWSKGNIYSKWPESALYCKMLEIARALDAKVQDDDGGVYSTEDQWQFDPRAPRAAPLERPKSWWRRLFG
jgi:hypothetical protein